MAKDAKNIYNSIVKSIMGSIKVIGDELTNYCKETMKNEAPEYTGNLKKSISSNRTLTSRTYESHIGINGNKLARLKRPQGGKNIDYSSYVVEGRGSVRKKNAPYLVFQPYKRGQRYDPNRKYIKTTAVGPAPANDFIEKTSMKLDIKIEDTINRILNEV